MRWLYSNMAYYVSHDGNESNPFLSALGLLTGDTASPSLWNLFFSDFVLHPHEDDVIIDGVPLAHAGHADDVMLFSMSPHGLQQHINTFTNYASRKGLNPSPPKTFCMVFGEIMGQLPRICMLDEPLHWHASGPYLGVMLESTARDIFHAHSELRAKKGRRIALTLLAAQSITGRLPPATGLRLFKAVVDRHLMMGADVATDTVNNGLKELEDIEHMFIHRLLFLYRHAPVQFLFSEMGLLPLRFRRVLAVLAFIRALFPLPPSHYAVRAWNESRRLHEDGHPPYMGDVLHALNAIHVEATVHDLTDHESIAELLRRVRKAGKSHISALYVERTDRCVLPHHEVRGNDMTFRAYLNIPTVSLRRAYCLLVFAHHPLAIVQGTCHRPKIARANRLCRFCRMCVESEAHALFECASPGPFPLVHATILERRVQFWVSLSDLDRTLWVRATGLAALSAPAVLDFLLMHGDGSVDVACIVARLARAVFLLFESVPMYIPPMLPP